MDQGSDFISDFRARRNRTQITREILSADRHISKTSSASRASLAPVLPVPEPVAATSHEGWGMIRDLLPGINFPGLASVNHARGFSGSCTRFQCVTHEASVEHAPGFSGVGGGGVLERRLTFSENPGKILGNSRASRKILGVICRKFWDFCIIGRHRSWVHQSQPIKGVM
jgi:hypothetical protein